MNIRRMGFGIAIIGSTLLGCASAPATEQEEEDTASSESAFSEAVDVAFATDAERRANGCTLQYTCTWRVWYGCLDYGWCWGHAGVCTTGCN